MRRLLLILLWTLPIYAQDRINVPAHLFSGAPSGTCQRYEVAIDTTTGVLYSCRSTRWVKIDETYNIKNYGARGDGSTDDTAAWQAAIDAAATLGGIVSCPAGTYIVSSLTLKTGVNIEGAGKNECIVKQKSGTSSTLLISNNFATLTGGNTTGGIHHFSIKHLTLDGTANATAVSYAVQIYGYFYTVDDISIQHFNGGAFYSEWSSMTDAPGPDGMEAYVSNSTIHENAGDGIVWEGPHDSVLTGNIVYENGSTKKGIWIKAASAGSANGMQFISNHIWGDNHDYGIYSEVGFTSGAGNIIEGARIAQLFLSGDFNNWSGGQIFNDDTGYCISFGDGATHFVGNSHINTVAFGCATTGSISFAGDSGNNTIHLVLRQASGSDWKSGSPASSDNLNINANVGSSLLYSAGNIQSTGYTWAGTFFYTGNGTALIGDNANAELELGSTSGSGAPFIDFHSSGNNIDYDSRIIASGGTGSAGNGTLTITSATLKADGLKTTGAASGKKVVCVDTSTGQLYASSTGTDCSN